MTRTRSYLWNRRFSIGLLVLSPFLSISFPRLTLPLVEQVPIDDYELPLGSAEVLQKGSDLTLLTWGTPVYQCETALSLLSSPPPSLEPLVPASLRSASIELIDLRTILPWDMETIVRSVEKTGRLVIVHEASQTGGVGGEISAEVQKRCFLKLKAPVKRIASWEYVLPLLAPALMSSLTESPSSVPAALTFEKFIIPDPIRILDGVMDTLTY